MTDSIHSGVGTCPQCLAVKIQDIHQKFERPQRSVRPKPEAEICFYRIGTVKLRAVLIIIRNFRNLTKGLSNSFWVSELAPRDAILSKTYCLISKTVYFFLDILEVMRFSVKSIDVYGMR